MATAPAACGAAIDVPLIVLTAVSLVSQSDRIDTPGAYQSTHGPRFDHAGASSLRSIAATVITCGRSAGDDAHAAPPSLPGATVSATPSGTERATARSSAGDSAPPRLMLATAGCPGRWLAVTQSMPAST